MQQLPNVKDETCKNQDCTALVSKRRRREAENKGKAERQGRDRRRKRKAQRGFVLITGAEKAGKQGNTENFAR